LGFHQARFGYKDIAAYREVILGYKSNGLPLDTLWFDIDYMLNYEDFTIDESRFPLPELQALSR
jgi:alpha-glucosidase/alpha-D-xyloside xylohydrolase